jgi:peptidoglycan/LPS O-acetylase OafA/YrhL
VRAPIVGAAGALWLSPGLNTDRMPRSAGTVKGRCWNTAAGSLVAALGFWGKRWRSAWVRIINSYSYC